LTAFPGTISFESRVFEMFIFLSACAAAALPVLLVWAAAADILTRRIPNAIPALIGVFFFISACASQLPMGELLSHALCGLIVLACGFTLFAFAIVGGGDAKLLAAAALWVGFGGIPVFLFGTAVAGAALALFYLARNAVSGATGDSRRHRAIPYGVAIAAGALSALPG
jgi:prepilin peptidase CpaA